jgi:hypothetical protein
VLDSVSGVGRREGAPAGDRRKGRSPESALVRHLIEAMVQMTTHANIGHRVDSNTVIRDARLYVRLAPEDRILLGDRAAACGMRSATYVSVERTLMSGLRSGELRGPTWDVIDLEGKRLFAQGQATNLP